MSKERKAAVKELKALHKYMLTGENEYRRLEHYLESVHDPFINYVGEEALSAINDNVESLLDKYIELEEKLEKSDK